MKRGSSVARVADALLLAAPLAALTSPLDGQAIRECTPAPAATGARAALERAMRVMDVPDDGSVLHFVSSGRTVQDFQSDRTYPPFFSAMQSAETWYDPLTRAERARITWLYPRGGAPARTSIPTPARSGSSCRGTSARWRGSPRSRARSGR